MSDDTSPTRAQLRERFRALHESGCFVIPNPFDVGSAVVLEHLGFAALATTSSGFAATLGRSDQQTTFAELVDHVRAICSAVDVPVSVDAEYCFAAERPGLFDVIDALADAGAAGISIEDYNPTTDAIEPIDVATERVEAAVVACRAHGIVLTARAENLLYGVDDLDDTVARLRAYAGVGADVVYAPGLIRADDIAQVTNAVEAAVNVLALPGVPSVAELARLGVRRVSTGGSLTWAAYGGLAEAASELRDSGTATYQTQAFEVGSLGRDVCATVFGD